MGGDGAAVPPAHVRIPLIQLAALSSETATFPIDAVKTRMQVIAGTGGTASFASVLRSTVHTEGVAALYRGLQPAVLRHFVYSAARVVLYEDVRNNLAGSSSAADAPLWTKLAAGFAAGGVAQLLASPADLVKVRLQTGTGKSGSEGFVSCVRQINAEGGIRAFWKGWRPNVARACLVNLGELATYDEAKRFVLKTTGYPDGLTVHVCSALVSGFFASLCSTPADVCKSRIMSGMYPTLLSCISGTVRTEGVLALWKGFTPNWLRLGPWQFVFWISYENLRTQVTGSGF